MHMHSRITMCRWHSHLSILSLWLLIIASVFQFTGYTDNEVDVLPSAQQFVSPMWLPTDWYLNLDIGYRHLFNLLIGPVVDGLGFRIGTIVARLVIYLLLALAMFVWLRTFQVRYEIGLLFVWAFFSKQSLVAGEWIAGGVETKTFAYAFVLLSCAAFFGQRYRLGFACLGAVVSFHILVGLYATCCTLIALGLNWRLYRPQWRAIIKSAWLFPVSGAIGLQAIIKQVLPQPTIDADRAWDIYVMYRVPHHVLPDAWPGESWPYALALATTLFVVTYALGRSPAARFTAAYALGSVALFAIGLVVYQLGYIRLLRFYWFRFPDVIVPFMSYFLIALTVNDVAKGDPPFGLRWFDYPQHVKSRLTNALSAVLTGGALLVGIWALVDIQHGFRTTAQGIGWHAQHEAMLAWIAENTPQRAMFLVDPSMSDFYVHAQRPMFVSFKHFPQSPKDILEWYERITLTNNQRRPVQRGYAAQDELRNNFYRLDQASIERIAQAYGIQYYLGLSDQPLTFEQVHSNSTLTLYKLHQVPSSVRSR